VTAKILELPVRLSCSSCGASASAACSCGVAYVPAREYAARAIAANPDKSNRAIAAETRMPLETVRRARLRDPNGSPGKRTGKDGKSYPVKLKLHAEMATKERHKDFLEQIVHAPDPDAPSAVLHSLSRASEAFSRATPRQVTAIKRSLSAKHRAFLKALSPK
jgi:hypothetical protein